jgi:serine O-acetyltransferase
LGSRVQIGAFARVLGNIIVEDDVFIGPLSCVTKDVPAGSSVTIASTISVVRRTVD